MPEFTISSSAFGPGEPIPVRHTCDGEDLSPPLEWSHPPAGTRALALVVDPDAPGGTFTHWLGWGMEAAAGRLDEGEPAPVEGGNDFGAVGYCGPCPPPGHGEHRYRFRLLAADRELGLGPARRGRSWSRRSARRAPPPRSRASTGGSREGRDDAGAGARIVVGRKRLPEPEAHERCGRSWTR